MNRVLVIGPSYQTEIIYVRGLLENNQTFNGAIETHLTGGSYTLAYNLAVLGVDTYLMTRMGFDNEANQMIMQYDKLNGVLFSNSRKVVKTPKKVLLVDKQNNLTSIDNILYDTHPSIEDGLPTAVFQRGDYGLINIINSNYLYNVLAAYPEMTWISDNNVPADEVLDKMYGITLDSEYLKQLVSEDNFGGFAYSLLDKGVSWVMVTKRGQSVDLYARQGKQHYEKNSSGDYFIGCHEVFVSMLTACLANGYDLNEAINHGINLANEMTYQKDVSLKPEFFEE